MKKNVKGVMKKMLGTGLVFGLAAGILSGCGNSKKEVEVLTDVSFPLEKTASLSFITNASAKSTQKPNERAIFQRLQEETNVEIDWTCYTSDQFADKKNLALSSGDNLPDGLFNAGMNNNDLLRYAKQGVIIPVEDLITDYMPNLNQILEENPEYKTMITAPDGHIYSFPWIEQLGFGKESIQAIGDIPYINKKWLDELGLKVPTTTEELTTVLKAFRDKSPEGKKDIIPMSFIVNNGDQDPGFLLGAFGYGDNPDHIMVTDDKKVICSATQEGYKTGISWLHSLQQENLIDPEAYTQEWSTYVSKGKSGRYGLCFTWDINNIVANAEDYIPLPCLAGPDGTKNAPRQSQSATSGVDVGRCVLTSACQNLELAAKWLDLMYEPLQSVQNNWGTYGEKDKFNIFELKEDKTLAHMDLGSESPVEVREAQSVAGPLAIMDDYYGKYTTCPDDAQWRLDILHSIYVADMKSKYVYPVVFMSREDSELVAQYQTDVEKYVNQKKADWILNGGVEKEWDSYLKKVEELGLSQYLEIKQKYLDKVELEGDE
ncbi:MAG: extracellular solute-binding protein [Lachnospiraceae bacterium]